MIDFLQEITLRQCEVDMLKERFEQFMKALKESNKDNAGTALNATGDLWKEVFAFSFDIGDTETIIDRFVEQDFSDNVESKQLQDLLRDCKSNPQIAYEFLTFLKFLIDKRNRSSEKSYVFLNNLIDEISLLVDKSNVDLKLYDLEFMAKDNKTKQAVLGKETKPSKKYPHIPSSMLRNMAVDYYLQDSGHNVPYLLTEQKKIIKVKSDKNKSLSRNGEKMKAGKYLYALSPKGGLYACNPFSDKIPNITIQPGTFHHSSFRAGQPVLSAGFIKVNDDGKIISMDACSGHYKPPAKQIILAALILKEQNLIDDTCEVRVFGYGMPKLGEILKDEKYAQVIKECREILQGDLAPEQKVKLEQESRIRSQVETESKVEVEKPKPSVKENIAPNIQGLDQTVKYDKKSNVNSNIVGVRQRIETLQASSVPKNPLPITKRVYGQVKAKQEVKMEPEEGIPLELKQPSVMELPEKPRRPVNKQGQQNPGKRKFDEMEGTPLVLAQPMIMQTESVKKTKREDKAKPEQQQENVEVARRSPDKEVKKPGKLNLDNIEGIDAVKKMAEARVQVVRKQPDEVKTPDVTTPLKPSDSENEMTIRVNILELIRRKDIELPSYIKQEDFVEYLLGKKELGDFAQQKQGKKTQQHQAVGKGSTPEEHAKLMRELQQAFSKKKLSTEVVEENPNVIQTHTKKGDFKHQVDLTAGQESAVGQSMDAILEKRLLKAADEGFVSVNKPSAGVTGYLLGEKEAKIEQRTVDNAFIKRVEGARQVGQAVQDKEQFLKHARNFPTVEKTLAREEQVTKETVDPQQPVKSEMHARAKPHAVAHKRHKEKNISNIEKRAQSVTEEIEPSSLIKKEYTRLYKLNVNKWAPSDGEKNDENIHQKTIERLRTSMSHHKIDIPDGVIAWLKTHHDKGKIINKPRM